MEDEKIILVQLCHELSQKNTNESKIQELLSHTDLPKNLNPFELTQEILKRLYPYQESS
ncbi:MAG: hypothetical protein HY390_02490 [Deltaproteobacteria bacterium]|nr:hypothetical protein [Deltaproteobacteria bacterium]